MPSSSDLSIAIGCVAVPAGGIVLSDILARQLNVGAGDSLAIGVLEEAVPTVRRS